VSGQRTPPHPWKILSNQRIKVGTAPAWYWPGHVREQNETDWTLNKGKKKQIVLASPESVYYLTTTPLTTNTKQAPP
jgi:hypothetical protein